MPVLKFDYSILIALDLKHILGLGMTDSILLNDLRNFEKMLFIHNWSMEEISIFNASSGKHVSPLVSYTIHTYPLEFL